MTAMGKTRELAYVPKEVKLINAILVKGKDWAFDGKAQLLRVTHQPGAWL